MDFANLRVSERELEYQIMKELNALTAISPIDGRYRSKTEDLGAYFSEFALIKHRVSVEVEYFIALCESGIPELENFPYNGAEILRDAVTNFSEEDATAIKTIERTTNHDVKAVEYFIKDIFTKHGWTQWSEFIHFGLTSQDVNNTSIPLTVKKFVNEVYEPLTENLLDSLIDLAEEVKNVPILARTHGQPASPTLLGKEIKVFIERLQNQLELLHQLPVCAKFGGATGNFNAHYAAYPNIDWVYFANEFVENSLGLKRLQYTTQIEHYDMLAALFDNMRRVNTILLDLAKDIWQYIAMDYFKQKIVMNEVGSSAMPHKVNPIDFENAEGNLGIANALFDHLANKLPVSRLQRDLTDSTVTRNIGVPCAHTVISILSIQKGLSKLIINTDATSGDLEKNWIVLAEAIQTVLRSIGYPNPYEALKALTRNNSKIGQAELHAFIDELEVEESVKSYLKKFTPSNYVGNVK